MITKEDLSQADAWKISNVESRVDRILQTLKAINVNGSYCGTVSDLVDSLRDAAALLESILELRE